MKLSLNLGRGRSSGGGNKFEFKQFLFQHAEKLLLALACVFLLLMVFWGYSNRNKIDASRDPQFLTRQVSDADSHINQSRWDSVYRPSRDRTRHLTKRAEEALTDVSLDSYPTPMPWKPLVYPPQIKREDPELYPVRELMVKAGYGALAIRDMSEGFGASRFGAREEELIEENEMRPLPGADQETLNETIETVGGLVQGHHFVCVTGLIPFQAQLDQYNTCFLNAAGQNPGRDFPHYFTFKIERAEINGNGKNSAWQDLGWPALTDRKFVDTWSTRVPEMADVDHIIQADGFLNTAFQIPPVLRRDLSKWALHPKIPRAKTQSQYGQSDQPLNEEFESKNTDPFSDGRFHGGMIEEEGGYGSDTAGPASKSGWRAAGGMTADLYSEQRGEGLGGDMNIITEFKLFRYFDFNVEPGKSYRYRVQLWIEDPNFPRDDRYFINPQMLSNDAAARILGKVDQGNIRHYRGTPWSQPSGVVAVSSGHRLLAGKVAEPGMMLVKSLSTRIAKPYSEPTATAVVLQWDNELAADVPVEIEVRRGTVANFTLDAEYLRPTETTLETLKEYKFRSNLLVVDIMGGLPLSGSNRKDELNSPGEILVMDASGNLVIQNELDDMVAYERNTFEPPQDMSEDRDIELNDAEHFDEDGNYQGVPEDEKI